GYYAGRYRHVLLNKITQRPGLVISAGVVALGLLYTSLGAQIFTFVSSKRPDLLIYTPVVIALLALASTRSQVPPRFLLFISNYSFSIYLLHWFVINNMKPIHHSPALATMGFIIAGLVFAIAVAKVVNLVPWGKFLVGRPYGQTQQDYAIHPRVHSQR
ncbi:MAG TPA: acyltransferase family protein, partial [Beutenbergiaceae bacterium]|nr:acyltransferase family protein [Beutenbergiaceae bacterium]